MSVAALPQWLTGSKRGYRTWVIAGVVALALTGVLYLAWGGKAEAGPFANAAQIYEVAPIDMEIKVSKDGEIHAINNIDVNCKVEGSSTITWIVNEGATVKKGDLLLTLDSTNIRQRMEDTSLELQKAEADVSNAKEMLEIQKSSNATNLESAEVALSLAQLDLKQYTDGTYPQMLTSAKTELEMAQIALNNRLEDLDQTRKLYTRSFVTAADLKKAELDVTTAQNELDKAKTALKVLTDYSHELDLTAKKSTLLQGEQKVLRTRRENASNLSWRTADLTAKTQAFTVLQRRYDRLKEQYAACNVTAPADGMVIYGSTTDHNAQNAIQEGTQVRERQLLIRLPDTTAMKAVVRINEAVVSNLKEGQSASVKIVGIPQPLSAKLSKIAVLADNSNRWWNPDLRDTKF
jgi:multidrug efflux pump subunit AcrA (membrane-fusion protein)